jgi:hypothetical protein
LVVDVPDLLTVEEAARLARIGRTKAYAMAREWRDTGGRSGPPVVDFGHVLRVPRRALEALIGAELTDFPSTKAQVVQDRHSSPPEPQTPERTTATPRTPRASTARTRRRHTQPSNQLDLFTPTPPTS